MKLSSFCAMLLAAVVAASAEQFLLIDTVFEFSIQDNPPYNGWESHMNLQFSDSVPEDWTSPNYANGKSYVRYEIHSMPEPHMNSAFQMCLNKDNPPGSGNGTQWHMCHNCSDFPFPAVYWHEQELPWWTYGTADWSIMGTGYPQAVLKEGGSACSKPIASSWSGWEGHPDVSLYLPITVRWTTYIVAEGDEFDKPEWWDSDEWFGASRAGRRTSIRPAGAGMEVRHVHGAALVKLRGASIARASVFAADGSNVRSGWRLRDGCVALQAGIQPGVYVVRVTDTGGNRSARVVIRQ
ncbi:MAG: hypothetical protein GF418_03545 [Chitinivibrionales bacterium]|nr:hypothetical protein [Chitinivibrionales bacterium]MBD3394678.1 hypothetical protein [Chitinivibrionales bacterium]